MTARQKEKEPWPRSWRSPAILAFPPEVYAQLDQLCELRRFTHHQLVGEALRSQEGRWLKLLS